MRSKRTRFQQLEIIESPVFGLCLVLDGLIQVAELDEYRYHETLVHTALLNVTDPHDVAIIGGGDGCALREVLRHRSIDHVDLVDLDSDVVKACKAKLTSLNKGSLSNSRTRLHFADGRRFLSGKRGRYDAIILDATDPTAGGPSLLLYSAEFYSIVRSALKSHGVMMTQATALEGPQFRRILWTVRSAFNKVLPVHVYVRSFYDDWGFVVATKATKGFPMVIGSKDMFSREVKARIEGKLKYLNPNSYSSNFAMSSDMLRKLSRRVKVIKDREATAAQSGRKGELRYGASPWAFQ